MKVNNVQETHRSKAEVESTGRTTAINSTNSRFVWLKQGPVPHRYILATSGGFE